MIDNIMITSDNNTAYVYHGNDIYPRSYNLTRETRFRITGLTHSPDIKTTVIIHKDMITVFLRRNPTPSPQVTR